MKKKYKLFLLLLFLTAGGYFIYRMIITHNPNPNFEIGQKLDSLNHVYVYYNGGIAHTSGRNLSVDGYNIGLSYQCVEFVKRYYYEFYKHKMPDTYGNAKDFFDSEVKDGKLNSRRNLIQYTNTNISKPQVGDLVIFDGHPGNSYGHVAIISNVSEKEIEIIQQNPGPYAASRVTFALKQNAGKYTIEQERALGWLRIP